jgi:hypothetical protein
VPVTLAQAALNAASDIDRNVIDEFRKSSQLLDAIPFDDVVNPAGGGATLTYGYTRLITQPTAAFRAINAEYTPTEVTKQQYTTDLKPLGGSFQIDRVLAGVAAGREVTLQMQQKIKAARAKFHEAMLIGDTAVDANGFDGLNKALTGSTTEINPTGPITDWSGTTEDAAFAIMDSIDSLLAKLDGPADVIVANARAIARIRSVARRAGYWTRDRNELGVWVERYAGALLVDPGAIAGANTDILQVQTRDPDAGGAIPSTPNLTDVYAVRFGPDGFHAVSVAGAPLTRQWLPDFDRAGAVKTGEVELGPVSVALKATKAAAVLRHVKVA